ncbi:MAG: PD40 domain-containing protein [Phycisphaerae bacterium]|nr:PD40 domain-containing protein [Phycisphaerae bacterium]
MRILKVFVILILISSLSRSIAEADIIFGEPTPIGPPVNKGQTEYSASISADGLELYYDAWQSGKTDLWVTTRVTTDDYWGEAVPLGPAVNSSAMEWTPRISADGLELYFASSRGGQQYSGFNIYVARRQTTNDAWQSAENLGAMINSSNEQTVGSISADGLELYYGTGSSYSTGNELRVATRATKDSAWTETKVLAPTVLGTHPAISPGGLHVVFSSDSLPGGMGGRDLWMMTRATMNDDWNAPINLGPPINSQGTEHSPLISHDCSRILFTSGGVGGDVWQIPILSGCDFSLLSEQAQSPFPADGAIQAASWASLSWRAGDFAVSHDVYLSDNFDDVSNGTGDSFRGSQSDTMYIVGFPGFHYPEGLVPGTTYYWRIDEVNDANVASPWKGDIWSFSIPPKTAYNPDPADDAEFVDPNASFSWTPGFGGKLHTVYMGTNFDDVSNAIGGARQGTTTYNPGPLELEKVYYWRVDEFDVISTYKGDIWAFTTPGAVGNPQPANGAADVKMTATLNWTAADNAASHELYFGADKDAVNDATTASPEYAGPRALGSESYDPGKLAWDAAYYWRVDEVYPAETVKGLVWSFKTVDFLLVDDFESYNDIDPPDSASNRIYDKWIDGFGTTDNGAQIGNDLPPYAAQNVVHGGSQAMIYRYDNNLKTSEATLTLVYPQDWTEQGVTKLSLWFRGSSANAADRIFIALNVTAVVYHADASATQMTGWNEWVIDLQDFADVNLTNVNTITIGIGTKNSPAASGSGQMYFDDIRLYRPASE